MTVYLGYQSNEQQIRPEFSATAPIWKPNPVTGCQVPSFFSFYSSFISSISAIFIMYNSLNVFWALNSDCWSGPSSPFYVNPFLKRCNFFFIHFHLFTNTVFEGDSHTNDSTINCHLIVFFCFMQDLPSSKWKKNVKQLLKLK